MRPVGSLLDISHFSLRSSKGEGEGGGRPRKRKSLPCRELGSVEDGIVVIEGTGTNDLAFRPCDDMYGGMFISHMFHRHNMCNNSPQRLPMLELNQIASNLIQIFSKMCPSIFHCIFALSMKDYLPSQVTCGNREALYIFSGR